MFECFDETGLEIHISCPQCALNTTLRTRKLSGLIIFLSFSITSQLEMEAPGDLS